MSPTLLIYPLSAVIYKLRGFVCWLVDDLSRSLEFKESTIYPQAEEMRHCFNYPKIDEARRSDTGNGWGW